MRNKKSVVFGVSLVILKISNVLSPISPPISPCPFSNPIALLWAKKSRRTRDGIFFFRQNYFLRLEGGCYLPPATGRNLATFCCSVVGEYPVDRYSGPPVTE